jgi:hypothetical protein
MMKKFYQAVLNQVSGDTLLILVEELVIRFPDFVTPQSKQGKVNRLSDLIF